MRDAHENSFDARAWEEFSKHLFFLSGNFEGNENYENLCSKVNQIGIPSSQGRKDVIYYMALPPQATPLVVGQLREP